MAFHPISDQDQPALNHDTRIWRYMDFPKLAALLSSRALYFCQVPLLGDPFEGSLVKAVKDGVEQGKPYIAREYPELVRTDEQMRNNIMASRAYTYASCWHANERESAAMWDLYARGGFGIAVRSTIGRLITSLAHVPEPIWIGWINYHDYETAQPPQNSLWTPMLQKRKSFEHEHEIRALIMDWERMHELRGAWHFEPNPIQGRELSVDLGELLERLHVAPHAPKWYRETVQRVVAALGYAWLPVVQSDMEGSPIFF